MADLDVEWAERRLCPDDVCVGVVGPDGRCKVCGKVAPDAGGPYRGSAIDTSAVEGSEDDGAAEEASATKPDDDASPGGEDERELCPDGACIGLIGKNGRCKECGKARA